MLGRISAFIVAIAAVGMAGAASAGPALLFDAANGQVLYAEDQDHQWHPASLTKIMTAYVVFGPEAWALANTTNAATASH